MLYNYASSRTIASRNTNQNRLFDLNPIGQKYCLSWAIRVWLSGRLKFSWIRVPLHKAWLPERHSLHILSQNLVFKPFCANSASLRGLQVLDLDHCTLYCDMNFAVFFPVVDVFFFLKFQTREIRTWFIYLFGLFIDGYNFMYNIWIYRQL